MNARQQEQYQIIKEIVEKRGGRLVSETYANNHTKIWVECENEHKFDIVPSSLKRNIWCRCCRGHLEKLPEFPSEDERKQGIAQMNEYQKISSDKIAKICRLIDPGMELLSAFVSSSERMWVKCSKDHLRYALANNLKRGASCRVCYADSQRTPIEMLRAKVEAKGHKLLSQEYKDPHAKLELQCSKGHYYKMGAESIRKGAGCFRCFIDTCKLDLGELRKLVEMRGGTLLADTYTNCFVKMPILCKRGHLFKMDGACLQKNQWCFICRESKGENLVSKALELLKITPVARQFLLPSLSGLRFDFQFTFQGLKIIIEFDGRPHFEYVEHFHTSPEGYEESKKRDVTKTAQAIRDGYKVIRIDYHRVHLHPEMMAQLIWQMIWTPGMLVVSDTEKYKWLLEGMRMSN